MEFVEDKLLKNELFYGFESILELLTEEEIKNFEDDDYRLDYAWEEGMMNDYFSANRYYYSVERNFRFVRKTNEDFSITLSIDLSRTTDDDSALKHNDFEISMSIDVKDKSADYLHHGYKQKWISTTDVVSRACWNKIQTMISYLEEKVTQIEIEIDKLNHSLSKEYTVDIQNWQYKRLKKEYGDEIAVEVRTKDKQKYLMNESDYLSLYKFVKKFDGYGRKNVLSFVDQYTKKSVTFEQQDIKSHTVKPLAAFTEKKKKK